MAKSGGVGKRRSARDKQRASYLKKHGIERRTGVCCICGKAVALNALANHIRLHGG